MEARRLTSDDLPEALGLVSEHTKLQRSEFDLSTLNLEKTIDQYYGSFDNDVLVAIVRVTEFKSQPAFLLGPWFIKRNLLNVFAWEPESGNPAQSFFKPIISDMVDKGRYTFYYTKPIDKWSVRLQRLGRDFISALTYDEEFFRREDWTRYLEEIVPAGKRSKYELHDSILLKREWPVEIIVVKVCMRNLMRNHPHKLEEEIERNDT